MTEKRLPAAKWVFIVLSLVTVSLFDCAIAEEVVPKAVNIAQKAISAMGGLDQWKEVAALRFDFRVEKPDAEPRIAKHLWDHRNSRDHVEGSMNGQTIVAWIDLRTKMGAAWLEGKKLEGGALKEAMEWTYARWVNDTYWLIMPLKLFDSGTHLRYEGENGGYDVLQVSFEKVGLTPGDQYWAFINKETGLMDRWEYLLQDQTEKEVFHWKEWGDYGGIKLSKLKLSSDEKLQIRFDPLQVLDVADPGYFGEELKILD